MADQRLLMALRVFLLAVGASSGLLAAVACRHDARQSTARIDTGKPSTKEAQLTAGKTLYANHCSTCHQPDGTGVPGEVPPLAGSDFLSKGSDHAIAVVLHGLKGELRVHGQDYDSAMPQLFQLSNEEVADVLTFVYNSWGNPGGQVRASDVAAQRYDRALAPEEK